jgi:excisionase family DNA binding protein
VPDTATPARGLTVPEVARVLRVGEDKVRGWIRRGEIRAINTAAVLSGKPRWVITTEALREFERRRTTTAPSKNSRPRRNRVGETDYYPE